MKIKPISATSVELENSKGTKKRVDTRYLQARIQSLGGKVEHLQQEIKGLLKKKQNTIKLLTQILEVMEEKNAEFIPEQRTESDNQREDTEETLRQATG